MSLSHESSESGAGGQGSASQGSAGLAARLGEKSQLDFDIEFFDRVLERNPQFTDVLRCQGQLLSRKGRHRDALEVDRQLVSMRPHDAVAHYNLACSLALLGRSPDAIAALRLALELGYDDFGYLETDNDLEALREDPAYLDLIQEYGIGEA